MTTSSPCSMISMACLALMLSACGGASDDASAADSGTHINHPGEAALSTAISGSQDHDHVVADAPLSVLAPTPPTISNNTPPGKLYEKIPEHPGSFEPATDFSESAQEERTSGMGHVQALAAQPKAFPIDANVKGVWSVARKWPLIPIHAALLPDGRMMTYGTNADGQQTGLFIYDVWDSKANLDAGHLTLPNGTNTDIFCSAQTLLPTTGEIFVAGGDNFVNGATNNTGNKNSTIFSGVSNNLRRGNDMNRARWYASVTTLADSRTFIMGGMNGGEDLAEIRDKNGSFSLLNSAPTIGFDYFYPRNYLAADGRIFGYDVSGRMYYIDLQPAGGAIERWSDLSNEFVGTGSSGAMYAPGKILQVGGNTKRALTIDLNGPQIKVRETASLSSKRFWNTATVLANGQVAVTGGSEVENQLTGVNNSAELWNPATGLWTKGASGQYARLYHSAAMLLPDATLWVGGGGAPGPLTNTNAEIYFPPYLFTSGGQLAARPVIAYAPTAANPGDKMSVQIQGTTPISQVALIRTGSVTHSVNFDQRRIVLTHQQSGNTLTAQLPANGAIIPPGYYMLFVLDAQNVPSVAKMVRINEGARSAIGVNWTRALGTLSSSGYYSLNCNANEALVGIYGSTGTYVNSVGAVCAPINANGQWSSTPIKRGTTGGFYGDSYQQVCPANTAVVGLSGRADEFVNQFQLSCQPLTSLITTSGTVTLTNQVGSNTGSVKNESRCGYGGVAYALYGNSGSWMDALGLLCRSNEGLPVSIPTPAPPPATPTPVTTQTAIEGGTGGQSFTLNCNTDEVLVGIHGLSGAWLDQIGPQCVKVDAQGKWISSIVKRGTIAGLEGGDAYVRTCPSGYAMTGFSMEADAYVNRITPQCRLLSSAGKVNGTTLELTPTGGDGVQSNVATCPSDRPGYGLTGRADTYVNAIGMVCRGSF